LKIDLCIDRRRVEATMAQKVGNALQCGAAFDQPLCGGVPQQVRAMQECCDTAPLGCTMNGAAHDPRGDGRIKRRTVPYEECAAGCGGPAIAEILRDRTTGVRWKWIQVGAPVFSADKDRARAPIDVVER
jgi:hypothetical protein